jgi:hypothetical protein
MNSQIIPWTWKRVHDRSEEVGQCLIWLGSVGKFGYPYASHQGRTLSLRRIVYTELMGKNARGKQIATRCGNRRCLSEHCLFARTQSEVIRESFRERLEKDPLYLRKYQMSPSVQANGGVKLNAERAQLIRDSRHCPANELARKFNVSAKAIHAVWRGDTWKPPKLPPNSVFNLGS